MKLRIGEQDYDYQRALQKVGISHLLDLKVSGGIGKRTVNAGLDALSEALVQVEGESDKDFLDRALLADENPVILRGLVGLVFICKRHAGETVTFEEAGEFGLQDLRFVLEDSDIPASVTDPTVASGNPTVPDAETKNEQPSTSSVTAQRPSQKKSKTSKNTSISE